MAKRQNSEFGGFTWANPPTSRVSVVNITETRRHQPWQDTKIEHPYWSLDYFHTGGALVRVGSEAAPWTERDPYVVHLYAPHTPYWEDTRRINGPLMSAWMNFDLHDVPEIEALVKSQNGFARFLDPEHEVEGILHRMYVIGTALGDEGYWDVLPDFFTLFRHLMRAIPISDGLYRLNRLPLSATQHPLVAKIQEFLRTRINEPVEISDIAKHVGMSVSGLIRRYRLETGETPMKTLRRLRVETSKSLILQGRTLADIAKQFQFYDAYHYSKAFKQVHGVAPTVFLAQTNGTKIR